MPDAISPTIEAWKIAVTAGETLPAPRPVDVDDNTPALWVDCVGWAVPQDTQADADDVSDTLAAIHQAGKSGALKPADRATKKALRAAVKTAKAAAKTDRIAAQAARQAEREAAQAAKQAERDAAQAARDAERAAAQAARQAARAERPGGL